MPGVQWEVLSAIEQLTRTVFGNDYGAFRGDLANLGPENRILLSDLALGLLFQREPWLKGASDSQRKEVSEQFKGLTFFL